MAKRTMRAVAVGLALVGALAGCADAAGKASTLADIGGPVTSSASATGSTPSSSASAPAGGTAVPQAAAADQKAAVARTRGYFAALTTAFHKGSTKGLKDWYVAGCTGCEQNYRDVAAVAGKHRHVDGSDLKVLDARYIGLAARDRIDVAVEVQQQPGRLLSSRGSVVQRYTGGPRVRFVLTVGRSDGTTLKIFDIRSLGAR